MSHQFPLVLQEALAAQAAEEANRRQLHPRRARRLWHATQESRAALKEAYPELEEWLFGFPARNHGSRLAELKRLLEEASYELPA